MVFANRIKVLMSSVVLVRSWLCKWLRLVRFFFPIMFSLCHFALYPRMENVCQCGVALCIMLGFSILTASTGGAVVKEYLAQNACSTSQARVTKLTGLLTSAVIWYVSCGAACVQVYIFNLLVINKQEEIQSQDT